MMRIRKTEERDFDTVMAIYARARAFMAAHGNPRQWAARNWPPAELILKDMQAGKSFVCENDGRVAAVFFCDYGKDIEPTYLNIEEGSWKYEGRPYGVVHRIASDGSVKGAGSFCIGWAAEKYGYLRMDTHPDNYVMQSLLTKMGFERRGIIHVAEDNDPRYAYEYCGPDM